jgi:hypothetical protein
MNHNEQHAQMFADQHIGCVACKESHHETSFCECGRCFFKAPVIDNSEMGTFVTCECGQSHLWD